MFEWDRAAIVANLCRMFWQVTFIKLKIDEMNHEFDKVLKGQGLSKD